MATSTTKQFPGLGLPIDHEGKGLTIFPLAIGDQPWTSNGVTLREQRMLDFISQITDKPDWEVKVFDEDIVSRWRAEADSRPEELDGDVHLSREMFDFVRDLPLPRSLEMRILSLIPASASPSFEIRASSSSRRASYASSIRS